MALLLGLCSKLPRTSTRPRRRWPWSAFTLHPANARQPFAAASHERQTGPLAARRAAIQALVTGKLQAFYETYLPHVWKRGREAESIFREIFARRPVEGKKSFLKQRKYRTFRAGLEPVSDNPVDLVMLKLGEMDRYLVAHASWAK